MAKDNATIEKTAWKAGELEQVLNGANDQQKRVRQLVLDGAKQILAEGETLGGSEIEVYRAAGQLREWIKQHRSEVVGDAEAAVIDALALELVRLLKRKVFDQLVVCRMTAACALIAECAVAERGGG